MDVTREIQVSPLTRVQEVLLHFVHFGRGQVQPFTSPEQVGIVADGVCLGRCVDDREHLFEVPGEEGVKEDQVLRCWRSQGQEGSANEYVSLEDDSGWAGLTCTSCFARTSSCGYPNLGRYTADTPSRSAAPTCQRWGHPRSAVMRKGPSQCLRKWQSPP